MIRIFTKLVELFVLLCYYPSLPLKKVVKNNGPVDKLQKIDFFILDMDFMILEDHFLRQIKIL